MRISFSKGRWEHDLWGIPPIKPASVGIEVEAELPADALTYAIVIAAMTFSQSKLDRCGGRAWWQRSPDCFAARLT